MTCQCICHCKNEASGLPAPVHIPELCLACDLMQALNSQYHGLPYVPPAYKELEPEIAIPQEQKDAAIRQAVEGAIG